MRDMRPEKTAIVSEIRSKLEAADFLILANYRGMKAAQLKELRKRLAGRKSKLQVVKNSFLKKAAADLPAFRMEDDPAVPLAIVVGGGDGIEVAKVLDDFRKEQNVAAIEFGFLDGRRFSAGEFARLIALPSRQHLLGMLAGGLAAPISSLASVMRQKLASLVYALQAVQESKSRSNK